MTFPIPIPARTLFARLFQPAAPVVLDIRIPDDIAADPAWFPSAARVAFDDQSAIAAGVGGASEVVIVCHGGQKLSQGVAARLANAGLRAWFLQGGTLGWRDAGLPMWRDMRPGMWCAPAAPEAATALWLAQRLLPRPAEVLAVATDQVAPAADRFGADILPDATTLLDALDRPEPALRYATEAARSPVFATLLTGHIARAEPNAWMAAVAQDLDALTLGASERPAA